MQQFLSQSPWDERPVRDQLAQHLARVLDPGGGLILDDTGFPKQGSHSVGVARQYSGTLGKIGNCQIAVTLQYATAHEVVGLDAELYLPQETLDAEGWSYCVGIETTLKVIAAEADLGEVPPYTGKGRPLSRPEKVRPGATSELVLPWAQSRPR